MEYFESDVPQGNGLCSDNSCPCPEVAIPRGTGYLYIEQGLVDFRRQYRSPDSARRAMQARHDQLSANLGGSVAGFYRLGPILVCEQGAKLRRLDLDVAAADAIHWWATGLVPLRATPTKTAGDQQTPTKTPVETAGEAKPTVKIRREESPAQTQPSASGQCSCDPPAVLEDFSSLRCGKENGWRPVSLPMPEDFHDVSCAKCTDIIIPGRASFFLEVLGKSITCPLCGAVLKSSLYGQERWDLSGLRGCRHLGSEKNLLDEVKRLSENAKGKLEPENLAIARMIPMELQLAGRLLLAWLDEHPNPSEDVINALIGNWAGHIPIGMIANDTFAQLSTGKKEGFYVIMQYGSAFIHQIDARMSLARAGHGMRGLLILNLFTCYQDWKNTVLNALSYDGRLGIEELVYTLRKDKDAYPQDSKKAGSWSQFDQVLKGVVPAAAQAKGCRKSLPRNLAAPKKSNCFVATAAFSPDAYQVSILRQFRDEYLDSGRLGRRLIRGYEIASPKPAEFISRRPWARFVSRLLLRPLVWGAAVFMRRARKR